MAERQFALPPVKRGKYVPQRKAIEFAVSDERPQCPQCGTQMMLARIASEKPDHDMRTFECPRCNHEETIMVKYR